MFCDHRNTGEPMRPITWAVPITDGAADERPTYHQLRQMVHDARQDRVAYYNNAWRDGGASVKRPGAPDYGTTTSGGSAALQSLETYQGGGSDVIERDKRRRNATSGSEVSDPRDAARQAYKDRISNAWKGRDQLRLESAWRGQYPEDDPDYDPDEEEGGARDAAPARQALLDMKERAYADKCRRLENGWKS